MDAKQNNENDAKQSRLAGLAAAIRRRPAMFFPAEGPNRILKLFDLLLPAVLQIVEAQRDNTIEISVKEHEAAQEFIIHFHGYSSSIFPAEDPKSWFDDSESDKKDWPIAGTIAASRYCQLEISDGTRIGTCNWRNGTMDSAEVRHTAAPHYLKFKFQLEPTIFGRASLEHLYKISGILRIVSALRAGTSTWLKSDLLQKDIQFHYERGLRDFLFEADYQRHPLHPGCLSFEATEGAMHVEGHLRFIHAGSVEIVNFVNFHPTQGGAHLEGLGKALLELFGEDAKGCRDVLFITNPDLGFKILLPHACIGALHVQTPDAKYYGPTKDVLLGEEIIDFVYRTAIAQLPAQWTKFNR